MFGPLLEFEGPLDAINVETGQNEFVNWLATSKKGIDSRIETMPFRPDLARDSTTRVSTTSAFRRTERVKRASTPESPGK